MVGASFGGYWATKLAHVDRKRLRAVVNWGGGIHSFFQPEWQERSRNADSYLFDLIEARANLFGKKTMDELNQVMPALSLLLKAGWINPARPCYWSTAKRTNKCRWKILPLAGAWPSQDDPSLSGRPHGKYSICV